jgi:hypothetical protein
MFLLDKCSTKIDIDGGDRGSGERIRIRQSKTWELKPKFCDWVMLLVTLW